MATATVLALVAACIHAGWNLAAKTSINRFGLLWAQFAVSGLIGAVVLVVAGWPGNGSVVFAVGSAVVHIPYVALLARGYDTGDLSVVYPVGRGAGAAGAAIGGAIFLGDRLGSLSWIGLAVATIAIASFADPTVPAKVMGFALVLAATIATYSVIDAAGSRRATSGVSYAALNAMSSAICVSTYGLLARRTPDIRVTLRFERNRALLAGAAVLLTYTLILMAFRRAPTGYVAILRESSVLLVVLAGGRLLSESLGSRRFFAAIGVIVGLGLVVLGRGT